MTTTETATAAPVALTPVIEQPVHHPLQPAQQFDLSPKSLDEALRFADILSKSTIVPKDFMDKPGNVLVAIQWGMELGLKPMQAMQNIAVINGRPSLWGDAVLALVRSSPVCEYVDEVYENGVAICRAKRRGSAEQVRTFSMDDAATAGLKGKQGPWTQYPKRMQQMRARSFALRDTFPDVLKGMPIAEEIMDHIGEIPAGGAQAGRQTPAQIAQGAKLKVERTPAHDAVVAGLEKEAHEQGFEAFKKKWIALTPAERAAIGNDERDRIGAIGTASDEAYHAAERKRLAAEGGGNG
jgi:hypothetical protein